MNLSDAIKRVMAGNDLEREEAKAILTQMVSGEATDAQIGAILVAMNMKGLTVNEITGFYESLTSHAEPFDWNLNGNPLFDVVGTGGDGSNSINISTTASIVVAGTGQKVAKHGNRSASSKSGSADLLLSLGARLDYDMLGAADCLREVGFVFLFAPHCHPAMRFVGKARQELGIRSFFNVIGPLSNPAPTTHILMGVYEDSLLQPLAEMLSQVGKKGAYVVHGAEGMDEFSLAGPNQVAHLANGRVQTFNIDADDFGFARAGLGDIRGGGPEENAKITRGILAGEISGPKRDVVVFNAAVALAAGDGDIARQIPIAEKSIDEGHALETLDNFIAKSQEIAA